MMALNQSGPRGATSPQAAFRDAGAVVRRIRRGEDRIVPARCERELSEPGAARQSSRRGIRQKWSALLDVGVIA
jgi:hypothetical protein